MNPRERFLAALGGQPTDRIPIFDWINHLGLYRRELGLQPDLFDGRLAAQVYRAIGLDACWVPAGGFSALPLARWHWRDAVTFADEWGTVYRREAGAWPLASPIEYPIASAVDWDNLRQRMPDPQSEWRLQFAREAMAEVSRWQGEPIAVVAGIRGPFASAWMLMGLAGMSMALYDQPDLLVEILRTVGRFWTQVGLRLLQAGIDALVIHDDMGSKTTTFFSPQHMRELILPHLSSQVEELAAAGAPVILHSCGQISAILPELAAMPIAGLNNIQRSAGMDLAAVKAVYGDRLCLIGNVDASGLMPTASAEEVEQAVRQCLEVGAPGGRYILATDHSFHEGIPEENIYRFIEAGKRYGRMT